MRIPKILKGTNQFSLILVKENANLKYMEGKPKEIGS